MAGRLAHQGDREAPVVFRRGRGVQIPAQRVGSVGVEDVPGVDHVSPTLGHLVAVLVQDQPVADHRLVGDGVEEHHPDLVQGVEPASGLVQALADEVGRERGFEDLAVLEGIVELGEGHRTRIVPAVDHVADPPHLRRAPGTLEDHLVHEGTMGIEPGRVHVQWGPGPLGQFPERADHLLVVASSTDPDGKWSPPEPRA